MKSLLIVLPLVLVAVIVGYLVFRWKDKNSNRPLSREEAQAIAENFLRRGAHPMSIRPEQTQEFDFGFVFGYVPTKYLETRNSNDLIPGTGPLVVDRRDRKARPLTTSRPPEVAIREYQKNRR